MVIDTSVIVALALDEPDAAEFERCIADDPLRLISVATVFEASMVLESRLGPSGGRELDIWIEAAAAHIMAVDLPQMEEARNAWRRFGRGRHPAALNYGDCFSYALAHTRGEPLLFKGGDFALTDIVPARRSVAP